MSDDVMADHLKWLDGREDAAFRRGRAKGRVERDEDCDKTLAAKDARIRELEQENEELRKQLDEVLK